MSLPPQAPAWDKREESSDGRPHINRVPRAPRLNATGKLQKFKLRDPVMEKTQPQQVN
jgi:hypothetical protein